jgi:SulP family sulfate permease
MGRVLSLITPAWLREYQKAWLRSDVMAGLTTAAVIIPKALAYATVAGLPVQAGLYTTFLPVVIYALLGTSRVLSMSTTATLAILAGTALSAVSSGANPASLVTASASLALLVGAMLVLAGLFRLGFVANFISEPVLVGFKAGVGFVIVLDQIPKLIGVHIPKESFFRDLFHTVAAIPHASVPTILVGASMLVILLAMERFTPKAPAPLIAVAIGIVAVQVLGLDHRGVAIVGMVPTGLPTPTLPDAHLLIALWPSAAGIALMSFTETIAAGRAFARSDEPAAKPNRELLATGLANIGGAFAGAMPAGGGTTQTAVNRLSGTRSQLAGLVTGLLSLGVILLLAPFIGLMPMTTLAAVVIVYSIGLIKPYEFRKILSVRRTEFLWAVVSMAGVMLLGTLQGILVAIVVSLLALAHQVSDPPVYVLGRKPGTNVFRPRSEEHLDDEHFPGLLLLRPEGRLFFANAERVAQKVASLIAAERPSIVAIDLGGVFDLEYTALKMLIESEKRQREMGVTMWLIALNPGVLGMVMRSPLGQTLEDGRLIFTIEEAVAHYGRMQDLPKK